MAAESKFLDILRDIGNEIPKMSTDFITPDGIDWKKLKQSIRKASFKSIMPACTLGTDLAMKLLENSNNKNLKDFVGFCRTSIALYSILDNIYLNVVPSSSMENRAEIIFWKNIATKFNIEIPLCDTYSSACAGPIPLGEILMYLAYKLKLKTEYKFTFEGKRYSFTVEGAEGNPPTMTSTGQVLITSPLCILLRIRQLRGDDTVTTETMYVLKMEKFSMKGDDATMAATALSNGEGDEGPKYVGGQLLTEHAAFTVESGFVSNNDAVQACLAYIYRELDATKYHYHADSSRISVKANEIKKDDDAWVCSKIMTDMSTWCDRAIEMGIGMSYALVGPPGTGKTSTCEHIMADLASRGYMLITCSLQDRCLDTVLDRIMLCTNMAQKSVILLDDLDSLDIRRKNSEVGTLIEFFAKVKETKYPVIVMSTINNPLNVDETLMRSGRMDETIIVDFPDEELAAEMLGTYSALNGYELSDEVRTATAKKLAESHEVSAADIKNLASLVYIKCGKADTYTQEQMDVAIEALLSSRKAARQNYCTRKETADF